MADWKDGRMVRLSVVLTVAPRVYKSESLKVGSLAVPKVVYLVVYLVELMVE